MPVVSRVLAATSLVLFWQAQGAAGQTCPKPGQWIVPGVEASADPVSVIDLASRRSVVLLGERHDSAADHRWQLQTVAALYGRRSDLVLGFEMFPRSVQASLDAWVAGELSEAAFLRAVRWSEVWGYPVDLYRPLFRFARDNRVPMVALNVERDLVRRVARDGWAAVPDDVRRGIGDPAEVSSAYRRSLARTYAFKRLAGGATAAATAATDLEPDDEAVAAALDDPGFARFVEAQQLWDRAMAEAVAEARARPDAPLVVVIVGRGHAEHGWGIPNQLADLGVEDVTVLLTVADDACRAPATGVADALFMTAAAIDPPPPPTPRLGIHIERGDDGVRILRVADGSIAQAAGLRRGDTIAAAAGRPITDVADLMATVEGIAPGTWLPLRVRRDGVVREVVARFPVVPASAL